MLVVDMNDRFPYFVSTYQVGFIVFSVQKAGVWWLHIRTFVANKLILASQQTLGSSAAVAWSCLDTLVVYMYDRFPYFVSTYQVGFNVFSGEKAGVSSLHIRTLVAHKWGLASQQTLGSRAAVAWSGLATLRVNLYDRFPYFVSTYKVGFIVFSGEKTGVGWLHIRTFVAHRWGPASQQTLGSSAAVAWSS
jgi:hypothetical protein